MADRKIEAMYREYGKDHAHRCADCPNLCVYTANKTWYKCAVYGVSGSAASDWAKKWTACGMYGKHLPADHVPLIRRLPRAKRQEKPLDGQMGFLEEGK